MGRTRKIRGGGLPAFKNAKPANLTKLSKVNARNFIRSVCTKDLPNYLDLFNKETGCLNNVCPPKMTPEQKQWFDVQRQFKQQCATAERLKLIRNIPAAANLDPSYIKTTADRLIQDMPALVAAKSSYANVVKGTRPAATAPITKAVVTAPARTAARTPATAATTKPVVTAPARTAATAATTKAVPATAATTKAFPATAPTTKAVPATAATTKVVPATAATTKAVPITATATPPSIMHQSIQEIKQNLQAVSRVLETMTKTGGATRRRRRRRN